MGPPALLALALAAAPPAKAWWGPTGHRIVAELALRSLPASLPVFLPQERSAIGELSFEPDRWRDRYQGALRDANHPEHFLEFEKLAFLRSFPPNRYRFSQLLFERRAQLQAQERLREAEELLPEQVGLLPYVTIENYGRLVISWKRSHATPAGRQFAQQAILFYAGLLAHYVADGAHPLHTTQHHDGWVGSNPRGYSTAPGVHAKTEDDFLRRANLEDALRTKKVPPRLLQDPLEDYIAYLRASFALVPKLYDLERAGGFDGAGTVAGREFIVERLTAAAEMLASLWYTAYQSSQSPR